MGTYCVVADTILTLNTCPKNKTFECEFQIAKLATKLSVNICPQDRAPWSDS